MTIIKSEVTENNIQADNTRYVSFRYTSDTGDIITFNSMSKPKDYDVKKGLVEYVTKANALFAEKEKGDLILSIEKGVSPIEINPKQTDKKTIHRQLLKSVLNESDIKTARKLFYPVWHWLTFENKYEIEQIAEYLDISLIMLQRVNKRFQALHNNLVFVDTDDDYLGEVD